MQPTSPSDIQKQACEYPPAASALFSWRGRKEEYIPLMEWWSLRSWRAATEQKYEPEPEKEKADESSNNISDQFSFCVSGN